MKLYEKIFCWLVAALGVLGLAPYFTWQSSAVTKVVDVLALTMLVFIIWKDRFRTTKRKVIFSAAFFLFYLYYSFPGYTGSLGINLTFCFVFIALLLSTEYKKRIFQYFSILFALSLAPSVIVLVVNFIGFDLPNTTIRPNGAIKSFIGVYYKQYWGAVVFRSHSNVDAFVPHEIYRICGMYDEPGLVGTVAGLILTASGFNLRDKKNIFLLVCGILTFSLAFFLFLAVNIILHTKPKITIPIVLAIVIFLLTPFAQGIPILQKQLYQRFDENAEFILVDNRTSTQFMKEYDKYLEEATWEDYVFGRGYSSNINEIVRRKTSDVSSWRQFFYDQGILGGVFLIALFAIYCFWFCKKEERKKTLVFLLVFAASFYQRPNIMIMPYMIIFFCGLVCERNWYVAVFTHRNFRRLKTLIRLISRTAKKLFGKRQVAKI